MNKIDQVAVSEIPFSTNTKHTLGVEIEFQVLDNKSLDLTPLAPQLLLHSPGILKPRITGEFIQSILELQTSICNDVTDVENDLMETCSMATELAVDHGALLYAASLHPFADYVDQVVTANERYEGILAELQIVGRKFISQGLHVHVGVKDGNTAIDVCNAIQPYLPLLLSLSTSSPFSKGIDTGLMSYRTKLFEVLPLAGIFEYIQDWSHFEHEISMLKYLGVIQSIRDLWWDVRPHPDFGTVEVRVCDLPGRFNDILVLVALIQGLVAFFASNPGSLPCSQQILRANKWQAVRHGLNGVFVDPTGFLGEYRLEMRHAIRLIIEKIGPHVDALGGSAYLEKVDRILNFGTTADYQRNVYENTLDLRQVIEKTHQDFWQ